MFNADEYNMLHDLVFKEGYPGYKPNVTEIPNGDGKMDADKRYAHIADKYLEACDERVHPEALQIMLYCLERCHQLSLQVAEALKIPTKYMPVRKFGALRVLEYPIGAGSNLHTDFNLFTLLLYRTDKAAFITVGNDEVPAEARALNEQLHLGGLGQEIGLGTAMTHGVLPLEKVQHSIVYFSLPDWAAELPSGLLVGDWVQERMARSRIEGSYK